MVKKQGKKKFFFVILTMVWAGLLNQTALRAQLSNPTLPAGVDGSTDVSAAQGHVIAIEVDATDPANTQVTYKLTQGTISVAKFYALGIPNGVTRNSISHGNFSFTFNQGDVQLGTSNITLKYQLAGSDIIHEASCQVTRRYAHNSKSVLASVGAIVHLTHGLIEFYELISYSRTATAEHSKTIYAQYSHAYISAPDADMLPNGYDEGHKYIDPQGTHYFKSMHSDNWDSIEPYIMKLACDTNHFLEGSSESNGQSTGSVTYNSTVLFTTGGTLTVPLN